jgi:hypothetical protein
VIWAHTESGRSQLVDRVHDVVARVDSVPSTRAQTLARSSQNTPVRRSGVFWLLLCGRPLSHRPWLAEGDHVEDFFVPVGDFALRHDQHLIGFELRDELLVVAHEQDRALVVLQGGEHRLA